MILAYGLLVIGIVLAVLGVVPLVNGLKRNKKFIWDFKPTVVGIIIFIFSAQYIWG